MNELRWLEELVETELRFAEEILLERLIVVGMLRSILGARREAVSGTMGTKEKVKNSYMRS